MLQMVLDDVVLRILTVRSWSPKLSEGGLRDVEKSLTVMPRLVFLILEKALMIPPSCFTGPPSIDYSFFSPFAFHVFRKYGKAFIATSRRETQNDGHIVEASLSPSSVSFFRCRLFVKNGNIPTR